MSDLAYSASGLSLADSDPIRDGDVAAMDAAIDRARKAAEIAGAARASSSGWFSSLLGADSADSAAAESYRQTLALIDSLQGRRDRIAERNYSHADALDVIRAAGQAANIDDILEQAKLASPVNAVETVAADSAKDVEAGAKKLATAAAFGLGTGVVIVAAVAVAGLALYFVVLRR